MKNNLDNIDTPNGRRSEIAETASLSCSGGGRKYRLVPDPEGVSQTRICDVICAFGTHN